MNAKKFIALRSVMFEHGITQEELAKVCCISRTTMCDRLRGLQPWTSAEMDKIGAYLGIDRDSYGFYFFNEPRFDNPQVHHIISVRED